MIYPAKFVPNKSDQEYLLIDGTVSSCEVQSSPHLAFGKDWVVDNRTVLRLYEARTSGREIRTNFIINNNGFYIPDQSHVLIHVPKPRTDKLSSDLSAILEDCDELVVAGIQVSISGYDELIGFRYIDFSQGHFEEERR